MVSINQLIALALLFCSLAFMAGALAEAYCQARWKV